MLDHRCQATRRRFQSTCASHDLYLYRADTPPACIGHPLLWPGGYSRGTRGIMNFNDQDRQCAVTPPRRSRSPERSEGEGSLSMGRSFATLRMTGPVLMVKNHNAHQ